MVRSWPTCPPRRSRRGASYQAVERRIARRARSVLVRAPTRRGTSSPHAHDTSGSGVRRPPAGPQHRSVPGLTRPFQPQGSRKGRGKRGPAWRTHTDGNNVGAVYPGPALLGVAEAGQPGLVGAGAGLVNVENFGNPENGGLGAVRGHRRMARPVGHSVWRWSGGTSACKTRPAVGHRPDAIVGVLAWWMRWSQAPAGAGEGGGCAEGGRRTTGGSLWVGSARGGRGHAHRLRVVAALPRWSGLVDEGARWACTTR